MKSNASSFSITFCRLVWPCWPFFNNKSPKSFIFGNSMHFFHIKSEINKSRAEERTSAPHSKFLFAVLY